MILNALKNCGNTISVLFLLLENLTSKKDEIQRIAILEILKKQEFKKDNVIDLLHKNDTELAIIDILKNIEDFIDDFIRKAIKIDLPVAAKNIGSILPALDHKYFINYRSFSCLFEKENYNLRNCFIDIIEVLILHFKEMSNIETIRELTNLLQERLADVNFYVRNKALGTIGVLFKNEAILKDQRNTLIQEILERIKDKTVFVGKKV